jgi:hypothetical protein
MWLIGTIYFVCMALYIAAKLRGKEETHFIVNDEGQLIETNDTGYYKINDADIRH